MLDLLLDSKYNRRKKKSFNIWDNGIYRCSNPVNADFKFAVSIASQSLLHAFTLLPII